MTPYRNSELLKLYPWLVSTEESLQYAKRRNSPYRKNRLIIPVEQIEKIMCQALRKIYQGDISIEEALKAAQEEADHLFSMYGYSEDDEKPRLIIFVICNIHKNNCGESCNFCENIV